jgi:hypothetical protein
MAHITLLQDACRPQQRLNPDEAVFQRLDILVTTVISLATMDEKQIRNSNGNRRTFADHPASHVEPERHNVHYGACIVRTLD